MIFIYLLVLVIFIPLILEEVFNGAVDVITHPVGMSIISGVIALIIVKWDKIKKFFESLGGPGPYREPRTKDSSTSNTPKIESDSSGYSFLDTRIGFHSVKATYGKGYVYLGLVYPELHDLNFPDATYSNGYIYNSTMHSSSNIIGRYQDGKIYKGPNIGWCEHIAVYQNGCIKKDTNDFTVLAYYEGDDEGAAAAALLCILRGEIGS